MGFLNKIESYFVRGFWLKQTKLKCNANELKEEIYAIIHTCDILRKSCAFKRACSYSSVKPLDTIA